MKVDFFLVVSGSGKVRSVKTKPNLNYDEISIAMNLDLPDSLFQKPSLSAAIKVDESDVQPTVISPEVIENIEEAIAQHSGIQVTLNVENNE